MTSADKWHHRFLAVAKEISTWSKDPSTKVGALLVSPNRRVLIPGYNGFPASVPDRQEYLSSREIKLPLTIHAELNAILTAARDLTGYTCYTYPVPPCPQCLATLVQSKVSKVVTLKPTKEFSDRWNLYSAAYIELLTHISIHYLSEN